LTKKGDAYFASRGLAHVTKVSFHRSGICRDAFTSEHGRPVTMPDRVTGRWQRPLIPALASGNFARLALLAVPTDYLSKATQWPSGRVVAVPAAPPGGAAFIEVGMTRASRWASESAMQLSTVPWGLLGFATAFDDVSLFVRWFHGEWQNNDMNIPASPEMGSDAAVRFWASDVAHERPIRLTFHQPVKDYEALMLTELGGRIVPGQEHLNWVARSPGVVHDPPRTHP
jgi:hypothetical protein